jgi:hypothetical protein
MKYIWGARVWHSSVTGGLTKHPHPNVVEAHDSDCGAAIPVGGPVQIDPATPPNPICTLCKLPEATRAIVKKIRATHIARQRRPSRARRPGPTK